MLLFQTERENLSQTTWSQNFRLQSSSLQKRHFLQNSPLMHKENLSSWWNQDKRDQCSMNSSPIIDPRSRQGFAMILKYGPEDHTLPDVCLHDKISYRPLMAVFLPFSLLYCPFCIIYLFLKVRFQINCLFSL